MFTFQEFKGNLFSSKDCLCHCVSSDFKMGAGIALSFRKQFGNVEELKSLQIQVGEVAILEIENKFIYYLVTKEYFYHKPTYESLRSCLEAMKHHMLENHITKLSMPRIGCGLDKLNWDKVKEVIYEVFIDTDIAITCYML